MFEHENISDANTRFPGTYIGVVEDINDPKKMGRVRVRIFGLHTDSKNTTGVDGIATNQLPWAIAAGPIQGGSISGRGWSGVPEQGSHVLVTFIGGDHNFPIYFASIASIYDVMPDFTKGFTDPLHQFPTETGVDYSKYGRGTVIDHGSPVGVEPANPSAPNYPKNTVLNAGQIVVEHDSTPGKERWTVTHVPTKSYMEIQPDGTVVHKSVAKRYDITVGNGYVHVGAASDRNIVGSENVNIGTDLTEDIGNNKTENIGGALNITVEGAATLTADTITLDGGGGNISGVVTKECVCAFTGQLHPDFSTTVEASK